MSEKEGFQPLTWGDILTTVFAENTLVVVKDELSPYYLIGGYVTAVDRETESVGVFLPDSGLLRSFQPRQLRVVGS